MVLSKVSSIVFTLVLVGMLAVPALAWDSYEVINTDNPTCSVCGCIDQLKIDSAALKEGSFQIGSTGKYVTISKLKTKSGGGKIGFSWSSELPIQCVIVKASNSAYKYVYNVPAFSDASTLWTYDHFGTSGTVKEYGISHVLFCYTTKTIEVPEFPIMAVPFLFIIGFGIVMIHLGRKEE